MKVEITMEKIQRVSMEFEITENQLEQLRYGENPFYEQMEKEIESGFVEYDYAVCDDDGNEIVPWG